MLWYVKNTSTFFCEKKKIYFICKSLVLKVQRQLKLVRRHACNPFEYTGQILRIIKGELIRDLQDCTIKKQEYTLKEMYFI